MNYEQNLAGDVAQTEQDGEQAAPGVKTVVQNDVAAVEATVETAKGLGHLEEDIRNLIDHLWANGVALVMHGQPSLQQAPPADAAPQPGATA
jgi:hypothetical protein